MVTTLPRPLIVKITCGAEAAERANQGWTVAAMGLAAGAPVTVWLTGEAVWFAVPGRQPDLALPHATPVAELVETVRDRRSDPGLQPVRGPPGPDRRRPGRRAPLIAGAAQFVEAALGDRVQALVY